MAMKAGEVKENDPEFPTLAAEVLKADQKRRGVQAPRAKSVVGKKPAASGKAPPLRGDSGGLSLYQRWIWVGPRRPPGNRLLRRRRSPQRTSRWGPTPLRCRRKMLGMPVAGAPRFLGPGEQPIARGPEVITNAVENMLRPAYDARTTLLVRYFYKDAGRVIHVVASAPPDLAKDLKLMRQATCFKVPVAVQMQIQPSIPQIVPVWNSLR